MLKLVKSKEVPRKACVESRVSTIFAPLRSHEDEKENISLLYLEIIGKKLQDIYSLAYVLDDNLIAS